MRALCTGTAFGAFSCSVIWLVLVVLSGLGLYGIWGQPAYGEPYATIAPAITGLSDRRELPARADARFHFHLFAYQPDVHAAAERGGGAAQGVQRQAGVGFIQKPVELRAAGFHSGSQ